MIKIQNLSTESFKKYGIIIEFKNKKKIFDVICREEEKIGWRIGYLLLKPQKAKILEAHPFSFETFEPVKGISVIIVAERKKPEKIEAFLLDKPVCLNKGIWHAIIALSENIEIKITENLEVESVYHKLKKPLDIVLY
ncbi:MAG: ureidoglycolate lyase [Candidatus Goldbacteria bacterium]|nr:ureidoglycolate lyase [Candidatus Goldiibacteriota bacterium]